MTTLKYSQFLFLLLISGVLVLSGCGDDESPEPTLPFETGVFISNEGPFQNGTGTITHFNPDNNTTTQKIFETENARPLGNIVQSITFHNDKAYIVVNNANIVEVVNANTFESVATIEGLTMPRYFIGISETKGYVSEWGTGGVNGAIQVIDLTTNTVTKTITTGSGTDRMLMEGNMVYAVNKGGFGTDSTVVAINTTTDELSQTIEVDINPNSIQVKDNQVFALCNGVNDFYNPSSNTPGSLWNITTETKVFQFSTPNDHPSNLVVDDQNQLYCTNAGQLIQFNEGINVFSTIPLVAKSFYALGFNATDGYLYGSDALDFASDGFVFRYETNGTKVDSIQAGIIPGGFAFK